MIKTSKGFRRQVVNILPGAITNFMLGASLGWVAPAIVHFTSDDTPFIVTNSDISWIASTYFALELSSPILAGVFLNRWGRKPLMVLSSFLILLSWIVILLANSSNHIILARAIIGISAGINDITWSIYLGEIATPTERGIFGTVIASVAVGGITFEFLLSLLVPYFYLAAIPAVISLIGFLTSFYMKETPYLLILHERDDKALKNLAWVRGSNMKSVNHEFQEIKQYINEEKHSGRSIKHFFQHTSEYKVYIMCVLIFAFSQLTGSIVILSYEALIMKRYDNIPNGNNLTFWYGFLQFVFVNLSPCFIETLGRRTLLIFGFGSATLLHTAITLLFYFDECNIIEIPYTPLMIIVLFNLYGIVFVVCILTPAYVIKSELFPQELKAIGSVAGTVCNALPEFFIMKVFLLIWINYGLYLNFAMYAVISAVTVIYIYILIPETKGLSLTQIQRNIAADIAKKQSAKSRNKMHYEEIGI